MSNKSNVETLFHELADLSEKDRRLYYERHQTGDDVRHEVEELIATEKSTGTLAGPVVNAVRKAMADLDTRNAPERCGPYELKELLGHGGMGSVYRAERVDGEVRIQVAIKLIRSTINDEATHARFLGERQILASLTHPNIARLLDAGHIAQEGGGLRPYLVMELVEGKTSEEWANGRGAKEIVELFVSVCDAVSYAHRQLIVHRDLKPSNILVTSRGEPKLLDFGIAKHLDATATMTHVLFTPAYASPEQVSGGILGTGSDIYSLGAVLYRLLTGRSPHQFQNAESAGIQASITQSHPDRPSAINPDCKGDLDSIILRCLRKEPAERYASVDQLRDDLKAYLESRPVAARRGESLYRARKFLRRYWLPVAAAVAILLSMLWGWTTTQREKRIAERRFAEVRGLAGKLLDVENQIRNMPESLAVRKQIVETVLTSLKGLSAEVRDDIKLRTEVANAYRRVAEVQARRSQSSFGLHQDALNSLRNAELLLSSIERSRKNNSEAALEWFYIQSALADTLYDLTKEEESVSTARKNAAELEGYLREIPQLNDAEEQVAIRVYSSTARSLLNAGYTEEAIHYDQLYTKATSARADRLKTPAAAVAAAGSYRMLGTAQRYGGELEAALDSLQLAEQRLPDPKLEKRARRERLEIYFYRGIILGEVYGLSLGNHAEGERWLQSMIRLLRPMIEEDTSDVEAKLSLGEGSLKLGQMQMATNPQAALETFDEAIKVMKGVPESNRYGNDYRLRMQLEKAVVLARLGRYELANSLLQGSAAEVPGFKNWPPKKIGPTSLEDAIYRAQAELAAAAGKKSEAVRILEESLKALRSNTHFNPLEDLDNANRITIRLERASQLQLESGETDTHTTERVDLWSKWKAKMPSNSYVTRQMERASKPSPN